VTEVIAGGADGNGVHGGAPPPVLLAALGAAAVVALTFLVLFGAFAGGSDNVDAAPNASGDGGVLDESGLPERVTLTINLRGSGGGKVAVMPGDVTCSRTCEQRFDSGTRVTLKALAGTKSTFEGWEDSCAGSGRCSIVVEKDQAVTARFDRRPVAPTCDETSAPNDPDCPADDLGTADDELDADDEALDEDPALPGDCADGRDNDHDGLIDDAQDPDCASGGNESGIPAAPPPPPPPPPASAANAANDCGDGRDNDADGLTDSAQDPDCLSGDSESGKASTGGTGTPSRGPSQCRDGKDNDGDGLIDKAQDPGCEHDSTEAD
jgi:hypothetical protein